MSILTVITLYNEAEFVLYPTLRTRLRKPPAGTPHKPLARASPIALCTLLQQWIRAAGSRRRAARWRWLCLVLPGMFSARPLRFLGNAAGSVKGGAATERSEACP